MRSMTGTPPRACRRDRQGDAALAAASGNEEASPEVDGVEVEGFVVTFGHRPEARSLRRLRTARCSTSGPRPSRTDRPRRTSSPR